MQVAVKNFKSCRGMDGEAFSLSLYIDGKRAAEVQNSGTGGPNSYRWLHKDAAERSRVAGEFTEHCRSVADAEYKDYSEIEDIVLATLIDRMEEDRYLKRHCLKKILFRVEDDEEGSWRTLSLDWSKNRERVRKHLRDQYGDKLVEIVNERFDGGAAC